MAAPASPPINLNRLYLNPDGRPYQLHTTSPLGRFDRWVIGGRWRGRFAAPGAQPAQLIHPEPVGDRWRCAGRLLHALDLAGVRADAAAVADAAYGRWEATVAGTPTAAPWQVLSPTGTTPTPTATRMPRRWPTSTASPGYGRCATTTRTPGRRHASAAP